MLQRGMGMEKVGKRTADAQEGHRWLGRWGHRGNRAWGVNDEQTAGLWLHASCQFSVDLSTLRLFTLESSMFDSERRTDLFLDVIFVHLWDEVEYW